MKNDVENYLEKNKIVYEKYTHPAVFTVEESKKIKTKIPGMHTKNLFLKDERGQFYLICLPADKKLEINNLRKNLKLKKLSFASAEELKKELNLTPGSVSLFGMIHTQTVNLILDRDIWMAEKVGFHPNINTSTLVLTHEYIEKFYNLIKSKKEVETL